MVRVNCLKLLLTDMGETKSLLSHAPLRGLPPELLDMVMFYVRDEKDLVSICNSSRALYQSARFALYKSINTTLEEKPTYTLPGVVMLNFAQHVKLYQTLRRPGVAHLVTSFQVCIVVQDHSNGSECSCDPFDSMLGEALQALINLQELYFECHCCKGRKRQRHRYLETLKARKIRQFLFYCYCSPDEAEYIRKISTAPCFQGVTSLALRSMYGEHPECADVAAKETLPKLKKLMCSYILPVLESLFAKGTVTHFICYSRCGAKDFDLLHSIVEKHPGVLHHLVISAYRGQRPYFAFKDPAPYLNLRHFGTFIFHVVTVSHFSFDTTMESNMHYISYHQKNSINPSHHWLLSQSSHPSNSR